MLNSLRGGEYLKRIVHSTPPFKKRMTAEQRGRNEKFDKTVYYGPDGALPVYRTSGMNLEWLVEAEFEK